MNFLFILSLAVAAQAATVELGAANPRANGLKFTIDGSTKYLVGTNAYWLPFQKKDADIDLVFQHMSQSGLKLVRTWGFNDVNNVPSGDTVWFQSLVKGSKPNINTGHNGLQRLDAVVKSAQKHGIKLIIPFVNSWKDYGGMPAYLNYFGGNAGNNSNWYHSAPCQDQYKKYIRAVVSRYTNSSAIFAWELANEPRCKGCNVGVIADWASATAKYIKSIDSSHMVALGDEGFGIKVDGDSSYPWQFSEGTDFSRNLKIKELDFGTFHFYPKSWGVSNEFGSKWVQKHAEACVAARKPCVFEEFGVTTQDKCTPEKAWQKKSMATQGMAGDMFWQYGDTLSSGKTANDGNTIYKGGAGWKCVVEDHVKEVG